MSMLLIREETSKYIRHDQLFKQLIHTFFDEFLEVFFPEVHADIDFNSITPLSEEVFTDLIEGESRRADIVIEAKLKGRETLIIIHVEPQSYVQSNFHERMYQYFSLLYNKYRKPILPIAIFSYEEYHHEPNEFTISFPFFQVLTFRFLKLELKKINWRDYIQSNNPVAAALLCKMGYTERERVHVKKEFLRMLLKMEIDPAKAELINGFFDTYLKLTESEEEELMSYTKEFTQEELDFIESLPNSWKERGWREGRQEGIQEGIQKGIQKGIEKGVQKGVQKTTKKIALKLLKEGLPFDKVAQLTDLNVNEVVELSKLYK
nr:Rpn family recombination-promoting nuclease/putative transposase [Paenibacillus bovis]